jgi:type I restriction enzyme S subunit
MSEWPTARLEELVEPSRPITYGVVKPGDEQPPDGVRLIRGGDVLNGRIAPQLRTIVPEISQQYRRTLLRGGELVVSLVGNPGAVAVVPPELAGANLARQVGLVALRPSVDARFVMYALMAPEGKNALFAHTKGSVQQVINLADLKRVPVPLPSFTTQRRIASILGAYDDLIEVNRRRIALLEEMARRLFEEWFVHFRFPGFERNDFRETEEGDVPASWRVASFADVCSSLQAGATPSRQVASFWQGGTIDWFTTGELQDCFLFASKERIAGAAIAAKKGRVFPAGTIFMAIYGAPTVGRIGIATLPCSSNQAALALQPNERLVGKWFLVHTLQRLRRHFNAIAQGAAQQNISKEKVATTTLLLPPVDLAQHFERLVSPAWEMRRVLEQQQLRLSACRDQLLPRLISGELAVAAAERELEAA